MRIEVEPGVILEMRGTNQLEGSSNVPLRTDVYGNFLNDADEIIPDMFAIKRNPTYGRTPLKGSIKNIKSTHAHTGYGVVQVYGGDWIEIDTIEAFNGIGVRLEAGNGTDILSRKYTNISMELSREDYILYENQFDN